VAKVDQNRTRSTLKRIAQELGISEEVLRDEAFQNHDAAVRGMSEELQLLRLFSAIADPEIRRSCLEYVRAAALSADIAAG
jgi:hypothetical protein